MVALALEGVTYRYPQGDVLALDGIDLAVPAGTRVALIGQNGSGKSTLVRHLNGLLRPTSGRVLHDASDIADQRVAVLSSRVGLVFQDPDRQIFSGSVRDEVAFGPRNLGPRDTAPRDTALRDAVDASLAAVGLANAADANPYDLGTARRKLLALASVLAMRTDVLVLDEPTTGQDRRGAAIVEEVMAGAHAAGRTVLVISHDMEFVARSVDRIVVLQAGRIVLDGSPSEVFAAEAWPILDGTFLEPPLSARVGAQLNLGSTPTDASLLSALSGGGAARS